MINIYELLLEYDYQKTDLKVNEYSLGIENVYMFDNKEAYIIVEEINESELEKLENKILSYQNMISNSILTFNINILYLFSNTIFENSNFQNLKHRYENDTNVCRKIFVNVDRDDSIDLLPFTRIKIEQTSNTMIKLRDEIKGIINNDQLYKYLCNPEIDILEALEVIKAGGESNG